jgi:hypothetical protein
MARVKEVKVSDTEGLDFKDFNRAQQYLRSYINDAVLAAKMGDGDLIVGPGTDRCYAYGVGGYPNGNANNLEVELGPGLVLQAISTYDPVGSNGITMDDPTVLGYFLGDAEKTLTLQPGDATNPRWDVLEIKIDHVDGDPQTRKRRLTPTSSPSSATFNKQRQVRLQAQIVQGTPAASPVEPAVTSGWVKVAAINVPANHSGPIGPTQIRDYRFPAEHFSAPWSAQHVSNQAWNRLALAWSAQADGDIAYILPPFNRHHRSRIWRFRMQATISTGTSGEVSIGRYNFNTQTYTELADLSSIWVGNGAIFGTKTFSGEGECFWGGGYTTPIGLEQQSALVVRVVAGASGDVIRGGNFEWFA